MSNHDEECVMLCRLILSIFILIVIAPQAIADLATFNNENEFENALDVIKYESFESLSDTPRSTAPVLTQHFDLIPIAGLMQVRSTPAGGHYATDGNRYVTAGLDRGSFIVRINLERRTNAFGFSVTDFGDTAGDLILSTDVGEASTGVVIATGPLPNGNELFFGFLQDTPFSSLLLSQTSTDDGIGLDGVYLQSIPEPSGAILAVSVFLICYSQTRRKTVPKTTGIGVGFGRRPTKLDYMDSRPIG